ncbi:sigma-70 family RNA polymerase sigma factor [Rubripirellula amarantea]|nr:sigma-70 family RNA polymerase sigma factor [Rubripirellula amarantea]
MNHERFLSLFIRHERELAGLARVMVPSWDAADDVLQESSVVMWRKIDQLQADEEFLNWAKVIVRFEALKHRRKLSRDRLVLSDELVSLIASEDIEQPCEHVADRRSAVQECLSEFSFEHRQLLLSPYRYTGGAAELAEQTGVSANSVYKKLGRLRSKLRSCVDRRLSLGIKSV